MKYLFSIISVALFLFCATPSWGQNSKIDSLQRIIRSQKPDSVQVKAARKLVFKTYNNNLEVAREAIDSGYAISHRMKDSAYLAFFHNNNGILKARNRKWDTAAYYFRKAVDYLQRIGVNKNMGQYASNLANAYQAAGNYPKAIKQLTQVLEWARADSDTIDTSLALYILGDIHTQIGNLERAGNYFTKSLNYKNALATHANPPEGIALDIANCYAALGSVKERQDSLEQALKYMLEAKKRYKRHQANFRLPAMNHSLSVVYRKLGKEEKAVFYARKSLGQYNKQPGVANDKIRTLCALGRSYSELQQLDSARFFLEKTKPLIKQVDDEGLDRRYYGAWYYFYKNAGNYKQALNFLEQYEALKDTILNKQKMKQIEWLETKFKTARKAHENKMLKKENKLQEARLQRRQTILWSVIGGFVLLILIGAIILRQRRRLERQRQQERLQRQQIEVKDNVLKEVASELHSGVGGRLSGTIMQLEQKLGETPELENIRNIHSRLRKTSHILALPSFIESNIEEELNNMVSSFETESQTIETSFYSPKGWQDISPKVQQNIYRIVQELFSNTSRHAEATSVELQLARHNGQINLTYEDNGKGYDPKDVRESYGYKNEIAGRTHALGGTLTDDSQPGRGSALTFNFPI